MPICANLFVSIFDLTVGVFCGIFTTNTKILGYTLVLPAFLAKKIRRNRHKIADPIKYTHVQQTTQGALR